MGTKYTQPDLVPPGRDPQERPLRVEDVGADVRLVALQLEVDAPAVVGPGAQLDLAVLKGTKDVATGLSGN